MLKKSLSQFLCDYFKDGDQILVNAKWLQKNITESVNTERIMKAKIRELELKNNKMAIKIESLESEHIISALENHAIYKLDVVA